jgi:hypothetical protein
MSFGGDIDDLYAAPNSTILPTLKRVHNIGKLKGADWTGIGPVGQREGRAAVYPRVPWEKKGAISSKRLRDLYNAGYVALTDAAHNEAAHAAAKGIASGAMKGNPVRAAGGIVEGVARSNLGSRVLRALRKGGKETIETARELAYPSPGRVVLASAREKVAYRLQGHTDVQGVRVAIENRKGSVREGTDSDGKPWRTKMIHPYGYLVDAYVGPDKEAPKAFVVHQHKDDGKGYDEDKVMLGFRTKKEAKEGYLKHYNSDKFLGPIAEISIERLRELTRSKRRLVQIGKGESQ